MKRFPHTNSAIVHSRKSQSYAVAISQSVSDTDEANVTIVVKLAMLAATSVAVALSLAGAAIAEPNPRIAARPASEADTSITREYEPAIVYLHDPVTHELVPQSVMVGSDEPVEGAVGEIVQSYEGQDMGISGYEVNVDPSEQEAEINFNVENPRGADSFHSLSSANQYSLFEAIRETLLSQPVYNVDEVIFLANGAEVDI